MLGARGLCHVSAADLNAAVSMQAPIPAAPISEVRSGLHLWHPALYWRRPCMRHSGQGFGGNISKRQRRFLAPWESSRRNCPLLRCMAVSAPAVLRRATQ
ncbi:hypothetical protein Vretimale_3141 [Volvox reticuliferus]|uniref:Uncharacterized protein n=1 Tax=Volvox reticuliferus TaxID=1737510 RepID=A0A8J4CED1_9CHLO|nr:hypothetical protein Vretifemale_6648 [Volvox reticuliferus]GIL97613.1 hypothetical protein Vretimale_3141 [Volvox reticuliferus]